LGEFEELQAKIQELKIENQMNVNQLELKQKEFEVLTKDKENLSNQNYQTEVNLVAAQRELEGLRTDNSLLSQKLQNVLVEQTETRATNKEKFGSISTKITELQATLGETQEQLSQLRQNEKILKQSLGKKEIELKESLESHLEFESRFLESQNKSQQLAQEFEQFKLKKRDEILGLQDKYSSAKQQMDNELQQFKFTQTQKQKQLLNLTDDFNHKQLEIDELQNHKQFLERRIEELEKSEIQLEKEVISYSAFVEKKEKEIVKVNTRVNTLVEQNKRLEEELQSYRENLTQNRDQDIQKLQTNMDEISKRLKNQVGVLLDKDQDSEGKRSRSNSRTTTASRSNSIIGKRYSTATGDSSSPKRIIEDPSSDMEEFEHLNKLLQKKPSFKILGEIE
jgi:chromosome segregation ATPase